MRYPGLRYDSPNAFTWKQRILLAVAPRALYCLFRALFATCRVSVTDGRHLMSVQEQHGTALIAIWHEDLAVAINLYRNKGWHTLTSYSFDGELAARCCEAFGVHAVRGSSSRGGKEGLHDLILAAQSAPAVGVTPDGPRGPRRVAKAGIAVLAARTGVPVVPLAVIATPCWRLKSWDRMAFPKPFSRIHCAYGEPVPPPPDDSPESVESMRKLVEERLNLLQERLES